MSKKSKIRYGRLIYLISFVWILGLALTGTANAVDPALIGWWKLNEGSGNVVGDFSGNNNSGTIQNTSGGLGPGGAVWETDPERGPVLSFNGDDSSGAYVSAGNVPAMTLTNSFTWTFWSKQDAGQATNNDVMLGNRYGASTWIKFTPSYFEFGSYEAEYSINYDDLPGNTWTHHAVVKDGMDYTYYRNGVQSGTNNINRTCEELPFFMGGDSDGERWRGWMSDVRIYSRALTEGEIQSAMQGERYPYALGPDPEDRAVLTEFMSGILGYSLGWKAGDYAVSHDVYFGENFDDVNDGTGGTFRGNQSSLYFLAGYGYTPNDPAPTGFVPGTTYYWRIDEVNDTEPNSPWKGNVWSFSLPVTKAYTPSPVDGSKFIDPNADLSWAPGFGAVVQTVYFGDDYDTVNNAITDGIGVGSATYDPGPLELDTSYYWRVDTFGAFGLATGDVWSFRTLPDIPLTSDPNLIGWWKLDEGEGTTALDWSGHGNDGTIYNANGGLGIDGSAWDTDAELGKVLSFNGNNSTGTYVSAGRIPAMTLTNSFTWAFWTRQHQDQGMEIPGQGNDVILGNRYGGTASPEQFIKFTPNNFEFYNETFDSIDYEDISVGIWLHHAVVKEGTSFTYYRNGVVSETKTMARTIDENPLFFGGDFAGERWQGWLSDVRIYDRALTQEEVKQTMRGDPLLAWDPSPTNGSTPDIDQVVPLSWSPGDEASQHDVYFGTDEDAVEYADISDTTGIYRIRQSGTSYTPGEGVEWGTGPYYWRIDEYNTDGTISKGRIWRFTVADFIDIDNFEDYDDENQIWWHWVDGLGYVKPDNTSHPGNGSGSEVGDAGTTSFTEETITHGGAHSMPFKYNNNDPFKLKYSEAKLTLSNTRDWTEESVKALSLWFRGYPASVGSFTDNFDGTYSMTGSGADIWDISGIGTGFHDEFHFAYKMLTGAGTITARVDSVSATHDWSKAGVMIRETLDPNSANAFACITPANGVSAQGRPSTGDVSVYTNQVGITAPHWVKLERDLSGNFTATHSTDGSTWEAVGTATPQNIPMNTNVYVGLAVTSHDVALTCEAEFSNVTITGNFTGQWASQDIGILSNDAEPLYVAIANNTGAPAVVVHDDPNAAQVDEWTEWNIDLRDFAGINLADVNSIAVGLGNRNNPQAGGSGKMYFDDIALYRPRCVPDMVTLSEADLNSDCVVDFRDLEIMTGDWLAVDTSFALEADLNSDSTVDFKDYAVLADDWLEEQLWPGL